MTQRTESVPATQSQTATQMPAEVLATAFGQEAQRRGPQWVAALTADYTHAVVTDGLPLAEYVEGLQEWAQLDEAQGGADKLGSYLAESDLCPEEPNATLAAAPAAPALTPTEQLAVVATPEQTAEQAAAAAAEAEAREEAAREEADATLKAAVKHYRQGEKAYRAGLLEAGRLAGLYVRQRLELGDKRAAAVQTLEGALAAYSSTAVDVNRLVACYQAHHLLAEVWLEQLVAEEKAAAGTADAKAATKAYKATAQALEAVPYGHYRDAWSRLVSRTAKDTPQEAWVLLPGLEADCRAAFSKAVADTLSKAAVEDMCRTLVTHMEAASAEQARQAKAAAEAQARQAEAAAKAEREQLAKAAAEARKAEADAKAAASTGSDEQRAELAANAEAARKALLEQQQATIAAEARDAQAKAEAARKAKEAAEAQRKATEAAARKAEAERKAAEKAAAKAGAKPTEPAQKPATVDGAGTPAAKPEAEAKPPLGNLLQAAKAAVKAANAKDGAEFAAQLAVEAITGCEEPDTALEALLTILAAHKELAKASHRACQAALVVLARKPAAEAKPEPVSPARMAAALEAKPATAEANGTVPAAA